MRRYCHLFSKLFLLLMLLAFYGSAQNKNKGTQKKKKLVSKPIQFATPTPIPPDEIQQELLQTQHLFVWQFPRDTNLPVGVLYREEIRFEKDSVVFRQFITKKDMHFYALRDNIDISNVNNIYTVNRFKMPYSMHYEFATVYDHRSNQSIAFEFNRGQHFMPFEQLHCVNPKRLYENDMYRVVGSTDDGPWQPEMSPQTEKNKPKTDRK